MLKHMPIEAAQSLMKLKGPPLSKQFITYQHTPKLPAALHIATPGTKIKMPDQS